MTALSTEELVKRLRERAKFTGLSTGGTEPFCDDHLRDLADDFEEAADRLEALQAEVGLREWQDISTAPKDGRPVLTRMPSAYPEHANEYQRWSYDVISWPDYRACWELDVGKRQWLSNFDPLSGTQVERLSKPSPATNPALFDTRNPNVRTCKPSSARGITYPPEMLPRPDEGEEADVFVVDNDGMMRKVFSSETPASVLNAPSQEGRCHPEGRRDDAGVLAKPSSAAPDAFDVEAWVADYELRGDSDYKPTEAEQFMLVDFANGLLWELEQRARAKPSSAVKELARVIAGHMHSLDSSVVMAPVAHWQATGGAISLASAVLSHLSGRKESLPTEPIGNSDELSVDAARPRDGSAALRALSEMVRAATAGGYVYRRGNPRPFAVLEDGRLAIDYFMLRDILEELQPAVQQVWWCTVHDHPADHVDSNGRHRCNPKLGGIMIPCQSELRPAARLERKASAVSEPVDNA